MTALFALAAEYQQTAQYLSELDLDAQTIADTLGVGGITAGNLAQHQQCGCRGSSP